MACCTRVCAFIVVFCCVYYMESIGGTYIISVIQSIEKQFQIPSKMSGSLISAQDVGYVPSVIFLSYLGSRGNRARWIGGGCILTAVAHVIISSPNFIFQEKPTLFNETIIDSVLSPPAHLLRDDVTPEELLDLPFIKEKVPEWIREKLLAKVHGTEEEDSGDLFGDLFGIEYDYEDENEDQIEEQLDDTNAANETSARRTRREIHMRDEVPMNSEDVLIPPQILMGKPPKKPKLEIAKEAQEILMEVIFGDRDVQDVFNFIKAKLKEGLPPQAKAGIMRAASAPIGFCNPHVNTLKKYVQQAKCEQTQTNLAAYGIVFAALILLGVGHSMPWTLGLPLLDDNIKRQSLPSYFAIMFFIKLLGPISGFVIGAGCNRLYYTLKDPAGLSPIDPRWIGAWWLGFLIIAGVLIGPAIALFCFPSIESDMPSGKGTTSPKTSTNSNRTPNKERKHQLVLVDKHKHIRDAHGDRTRSPSQSETVTSEIKTFFIALAAIMRCPVYMYSLAGRVFDAFAFKGFYAFLPKYLDNHYGIPQFKANLLIAGYGVVSFALGIFGGSFLMRKLKLEGRRAAAYVAACSLLAAALSVSSILLGCESTVNTLGQQGIKSGFNFTSGCNQHCNCEPVKLMPVCSDIGTVYYSPCHAGCSNMTMIGPGKMNFSSCACIDSGQEVRRSWCVDDCGPATTGYFVLATLSGLASGFGVVPAILIVLRSVPAEWRSISIGVNGFVVSIGTFFSPPFFGAIIDSACVLWEDTCGDTSGSCMVYEPTKLRTRLHVVYGVLRACGCLFDMAVLYYARDLKIISDDDNDTSSIAKEREEEKDGLFDPKSDPEMNDGLQ